ncbi:alpha/beta fold hydrolase [Aurantimonas sp. VKM B-3413]|uniref:alpha/beta fold hydrolase n=1 Tax=Aurantimonas sp. VKM B-3413 TaxID=2779401 RepID=UPI001E62D988|nr:alpha/beta hydrolase [Aurantimonas sp. VKM B-3413]MCB8836570.1 alpha/beta hydrolase [Aurantimonas sp. VKM B-3413]
MSDPAFQDIRYRNDGLELAGRLYGSPDESRLPLVCLSGLTRNARDFHPLAALIRSGNSKRAVVAFDYRGRGRSDHAEGPDAYTIPAEAGDIAAGLDHLGIGRAIFLGTSRGALVIQMLAAVRPDLIAGAIFNDAGPRLEPDGLRLIRDTVGRIESFPDWQSAVNAVESANARTFPIVRRPDFERFARAGFAERDGRIVGDYDSRLLEPLRTLDLEADLPELWDLFALLREVPLLVIRGEFSTLFAAATVERMHREHREMQSLLAIGQGHAPMLEVGGLADRIDAFLAMVDERSRP